MEAITVGLVALVGGFGLGWKWRSKATQAAIDSVSSTQAIDRANILRTQAIDRANFLQTLRRELANIMVWRDPRRYLQLYEEIHAEASSLKSWRAEEARRRHGELSEKYQFYSDFDAIGTRDYVLYADGVSMMTYADLEGIYRDIVMFEALSEIVDEAWKEAAKLFVHMTSDEELRHLTEYVGRIDDTKLELRIERAIEYFDLARAKDEQGLDNDFYSISYLPHFAEMRYGVHLKRTNEFGIYSSFEFDDGRTLESYYRSDSTFRKEEPLYVLGSVLEESRLDR